ncbi:phosphoesterase [Leptospira ilyithenensis]|uniref:Phosphoesterase n=1 Tax=Leptospira ilyithenensis TaxID=2484901 RepID=A0A4R9LP79_9LEPT|nr:phosphoesterase [Leptospira ilyithenensis]TGN08489.1 phosphoesterase [Leptospira ilyithenensis]
MLFLTFPPIVSDPVLPKKKVTKGKLILSALSILLLVMTIYQITVVLFYRTALLETNRPFSGNVWTNPYEKGDWAAHSEKVSLHIHSNEVSYTPERHTVEEIESVYNMNGFSLISFSDYDRITKSKLYSFLPGYEWGQNIKKRHALSIGSETQVPDYFPVYASRENIAWTFRQMRESGGYVVIAHPKLHSSFSKEDLEKIPFYQAIEVLTPYGDDSKILDHLLSRGRNVHCMASDDLHYFPEETIQSFSEPLWKDILQKMMFVRGKEGESLLRYVSTANGNRSPDSVKADLKEGSFFCVKKFFQGAADPNLPNIRFSGKDKISLTSGERYMEVRWIGNGGTIKKIDPDTDRSEYELSPEDTYIRLEITSLTGKILSNAIYRTTR